MGHPRSPALSLRLLTASLSLSLALLLVGFQVGYGSMDTCADDCEQECQDFCGCLHCLIPPSAIAVTSVSYLGYSGNSISSCFGIRAGTDQAWVPAIDHPPQLPS